MQKTLPAKTMVINKTAVEAKSRPLKIEGWSHAIEYYPICHGIEIYSHFPMPDNVRKELSNIPYAFRLTGIDLYNWISNKFILISIQEEIDKEVLKEIETGLRQV